MNHGELDTGSGESWLNPALARWAWRHWFSLRPSLLFSLLIVTSLILHDGRLLAWPDILQVSMWLLAMAFVEGFTDFSSQPKLEMGIFLLARPVSRRQLYNTLIRWQIWPPWYYGCWPPSCTSWRGRWCGRPRRRLLLPTDRQ